MKILVTGCNGQLGHELSTSLERLMPGLTVYTDVDTLDLRDGAAVKAFVADHDIDRIVNCAAYTAVDRAETEGAQCLEINFEAVKNIAEAAEAVGAKVVHISTDYVYDGRTNTPYVESDKVNPLSQYGSSKRKGETVLLARCPDSIVIRTQWLYSPHGSNFVKTMLKLAGERKRLEVVADQIGTPTSATDLAEAITAILAAPQWRPGVYHFSNEGVASWFDLAKAIFRLAGIEDVEVVPVTTAEFGAVAARPLYAVLDKTLIKKTFNLKIPYWLDSLKECLTKIER